MNNFLTITVAGVLIALLILLTDPFMVWMPAGLQMLVLLAAAFFACIWVGFVLYEHPTDEREMFHTMQAGRIAYLSGIAVLILALLVQGFAHAIDPWIVATLGIMVIMKLASRMYAGRYQ